MKKVERRYFFTSKHYPEGNYNELHPCRIVRYRLIERGWYLNSFYRVSRFSGIKLGVVSFGLISGYRSFRVPYLAFHWKNKFVLPTFLLGNRKLLFIFCEYGNNNWKSSVRMAVAKLKRNGQWKKIPRR